MMVLPLLLILCVVLPGRHVEDSETTLRISTELARRLEQGPDALREKDVVLQVGHLVESKGVLHFDVYVIHKGTAKWHNLEFDDRGIVYSVHTRLLPDEVLVELFEGFNSSGILAERSSPPPDFGLGEGIAATIRVRDYTASRMWNDSYPGFPRKPYEEVLNSFIGLPDEGWVLEKEPVELDANDELVGKIYRFQLLIDDEDEKPAGDAEKSANGAEPAASE